MDRRFTVDGIELAGHLARPVELHPRAQPGLVIAHGFPAEVGGGINSTASFPELADRIATELGWVALAYSSRGVGDSAGDFSLNGWLRDLNGAVTHLRQSAPVDAVYLLGFGTGGALAIEAAAANPKITGVAAVGAPADFADWARNPRKLLVLAREIGIIDNPSFPASFDTWAEGLKAVRAADAASRLAPRELMVLHGSDDDSVPVFDARAVADGHGAADLRIVQGGGHHLRHDPRAVAIILGWLERQRSALLASTQG
ncbi:MAG: alpha/beta fold hydrolase [Actinomycetota bacterium]